MQLCMNLLYTMLLTTLANALSHRLFRFSLSHSVVQCLVLSQSCSQSLAHARAVPPQPPAPVTMAMAMDAQWPAINFN
uniref:Putative secreted protein n=1 Tax=Anopheles darlingi TaxID=43151 RepID=A0A2M4D7S4_ANODA